MKVTHKPIKEIIIYELVKIPSKLYPKYCSGGNLTWCNGFLINIDEIDAKTQSREIISKQTYHIKRLHYCEMNNFPKEFKNSDGVELKILDATYSPLFTSIATFLKEEKKK